MDDPDFVEAALATGALGYVLKCSVGSDLTPAIQSAVEGKCFVSRALAGTNQGNNVRTCIPPEKGFARYLLGTLHA